MTIFNTIYDGGRRIPYVYQRAQEFMSGRWHRRDGDTYGIVAPQPPIKEPSSADDPPGDLRPTPER